MEEMGKMKDDPSIKQEQEDARDAQFAEADADKDGRLKREESKQFAILHRAWKVERYGGDMDEFADDLRE